MFYHLQNNITPEWPYAFVPLIFKPIYKLFGLMSEPYALLGILTYSLATFLVYLLVFSIVKKRLVAFFSAAFFATGYIGLDQFTQLAVLSVNNISNIFICITLIIYLRFIQTKKKIYYFFCLLIFILTMVIFPFRVFPLLLFMPTAHVLFTLNLSLKSSTIKQLLFIILLQAPFFIIAYFSGIFSYGSDPNVETVVSNFNLWESILVVITPEFFSEIPRVVGRFVFPEPISSFVFKTVITQTQYFLIGSYFILLSLIVGIFLFSNRKYKVLARAILIFLIMTVGGFIGNLILLPSFDSNGPVNRYLNLSFIGYAAWLSTLIHFLLESISNRFNKKLFSFYSPFMIIIIIAFMAMSITYQKGILTERSNPSRNFFKQLKEYVPEISHKTIFFFDYADYYPVYSRFGNIMVGAYLPREAPLAVHYKKNLNLIKIPNSFNEFITEIKKSPNQKFYTFYYDEKGLHNTTNAVVDLLTNGGKKEILKTEKDAKDLLNPKVNVPVNNTYSLAPYKLNFSLRVTPLESSVFSFPYSNDTLDNKIVDDYKTEKFDKNKLFQYLDSRRIYYETISVTTSSGRADQMHAAEQLVDDREDTYWLDDQSSYIFGLKPWIEIDLGQVREIGKVLWVNESEPRFPKKFIIESSKDKKSWERVKVEKRERLSEASLVEIITLSPVNARFIKLDILSTEAFEPGFSEIEVIDKKYTDVDLMSARRIKDNPFEFISNSQDLSATYDFLRDNSTLIIQTLTNREKQISDIYDLKLPIYIDGLFHQYSIDVPPRGLNLKKIIFKLPYPANMSVSDINIEYLPLEILNSKK